MPRSAGRSALISGASIAGPALAFWLARMGWAVTVVERAPALRSGGYPIDVRGAAVDVINRMGLLPDIEAAHIDTRAIVFFGPGGRRIGSVDPEAISGGVRGRDYEVARGALAQALWKHTNGDVEYVFGDSIASLDDTGGAVDVRFAGGAERTYDLVFGADGLHSIVRELAFGPERPFHRYLGWCFAGFTMPNTQGIGHTALMYNEAGIMASIYAAGDTPERTFTFLTAECPMPDDATLGDNERMRSLILDVFRGNDNWELPAMVATLEGAEDVFCDSVSQIEMPAWSAGRVALLGDAAHATSFLSGQGSSCALVSAYTLAACLAAHPHHTEAFDSFERTTRRFVELNQAIAHGGTPVCVSSARALRIRNGAIKYLVPVLARTGLARRLGGKNRAATTAIDLPLVPVAVA